MLRAEYKCACQGTQSQPDEARDPPHPEIQPRAAIDRVTLVVVHPDTLRPRPPVRILAREKNRRPSPRPLAPLDDRELCLHPLRAGLTTEHKLCKVKDRWQGLRRRTVRVWRSSSGVVKVHARGRYGEAGWERESTGKGEVEEEKGARRGSASMPFAIVADGMVCGVENGGGIGAENDLIGKDRENSEKRGGKRREGGGVEVQWLDNKKHVVATNRLSGGMGRVVGGWVVSGNSGGSECTKRARGGNAQEGCLAEVAEVAIAYAI
ncbi:hypothetical protein R3P38DRAFT_3364407 [Favolaschia claudopus]|uniref:Uncharacterized protein n=1 Tax=Favolaschia claudopus TaxID=2862362 RepID=A0AAW0AJ92_9AGAR